MGEIVQTALCWLKTFFFTFLKPHSIYFPFGSSVWKKSVFLCCSICYECGWWYIFYVKWFVVCVHTKPDQYLWSNSHSLMVIEKEDEWITFFFVFLPQFIIKITTQIFVFFSFKSYQASLNKSMISKSALWTNYTCHL